METTNLNRAETKTTATISRTLHRLGEAAKGTGGRVAATAKFLDRSVHANAWAYMGGVAAAATLLGYVLGRGARAPKRGISDVSLH